MEKMLLSPVTQARFWLEQNWLALGQLFLILAAIIALLFVLKQWNNWHWPHIRPRH